LAVPPVIRVTIVAIIVSYAKSASYVIYYLYDIQ